MQALLLEQSEGHIFANIRDISINELPQREVTVDIHWSSLNYKDALAISGKGNIVRQFPMIPGIDFAGKVNHSTNSHFKPGDSVLLTGWGVGEQYWGGLAECASVASQWLTPLPAGLTERQAMIIGTAGLTAMLCVMALEESAITPDSGDIVVSGASGGVGSCAVTLLATLGYSVTAITGRDTNHDYLRHLGATRILTRAEFSRTSRPLEKQCWAGAIDTVGDALLATLLSQMRYNATVAACGLAGGSALPTTVLPFILRNVRLQGVDSVMVPSARREIAWQRLAQLLPAHFYQDIEQEITLTEVVAQAAALLANQVTGRTLVRIRQ